MLVCVVSFPNVHVISQYDLNPGLKLTNLGIIESSCLCRIEENCGGVDLIAFACQLLVLGLFGPRIADILPVLPRGRPTWPVGSTGPVGRCSKEPVLEVRRPAGGTV